MVSILEVSIHEFSRYRIIDNPGSIPEYKDKGKRSNQDPRSVRLSVYYRSPVLVQDD